jgi:hypothetical protein
MSARIGTMKLLRLKEKELEHYRITLDVSLEYGLDLLAKDMTIRIIRLVKIINEKGGQSESILHC